MFDNYIRFAVTQEKDKSDLEKIADFLHKEAQMTSDAGAINFNSDDSINKRDERKGKKYQERPVFTINQTEHLSRTSTNEKYTQDKHCLYCGIKTHEVSTCRDFARAPIAYRWKIVRTNRLCYKCFSIGHSRYDCDAENCKLCNQKHNTLLHYTETNEKENQSTSRVNRSNVVSEQRQSLEKYSDLSIVNVNSISRPNL